MTTVLVVAGEQMILRVLRINLSARGYDIVAASTGAVALRSATEQRPDVVVLDLWLPDMSAIDVLADLGAASLPVIALSASTEPTDVADASDNGAHDYLTKPFGMNEFLHRLRDTIECSEAAADADEQRNASSR